MINNTNVENDFIGKSPRVFNFTYTKLYQNNDSDSDVVDVIDNDQDKKYTLTIKNGEITKYKPIPYQKKEIKPQRKTAIEILDNLDKDEIKKMLKDVSKNTGVGAALGAALGASLGSKSSTTEAVILGALGGLLGAILEEELNKE